MKISDNCLNLIAKWEGIRNKAYLCPAKVWTIGYGTTKWPDGSRVKEGQTITKEEAWEIFRKQVQQHADTIQSGKYVSRDACIAAMTEVLEQKYFAYVQLVSGSNDENGWRYMSGKYTNIEAARQAATRALVDNKINFASILGRLEKHKYNSHFASLLTN